MVLKNILVNLHAVLWSDRDFIDTDPFTIVLIGFRQLLADKIFNIYLVCI